MSKRQDRGSHMSRQAVALKLEAGLTFVSEPIINLKFRYIRT